MKNVRKALSLLLCFLLILFCGCNNNQNKNVVEKGKEKGKEKETVVNIFIQYGKYKDGRYIFEKTNSQPDSITSYAFIYNPADDLFTCVYSVSSYDTSTSSIYESGTFVFSWGNLESGAFYGQHTLFTNFLEDEVANLQFQYTVNNFSGNMDSNDYTSTILKNTFPQLSNNEIAIYSKSCFDCIKEGLNYAKTIISSYTDNIILK